MGMLMGNKQGMRNQSPAYVGNLLTSVLACWEMETALSVDETGVNNMAASNVTVASTGVMGNCINLNGSNQRAYANNSASLNLGAYANDFTIAMWVKGTSPTPTSSHNRILEKRLNSTGRYPYSWIPLWSSSDDILIATYDGSNVMSIQLNGNLVWDGSWHLICQVMNTSTDQMEVWLDGSLWATTTNNAVTSTANTGRVNFGVNDIESVWYRGNIDQTSMWSRQLTSDEHSALYNGGLGRTYNTW